MIHSLPSSEPLTAQKLFSKLYVSYYARLVRFASLYVGAMGDAENIVQDFSIILENFCLCLIQRTLGELPNFGVMIWQLYYMLRSALICFQVTRFRNKGNHFI